MVSTGHIDVAKDGVATQSSTLQDKFEASNIIDNDPSTFSHTNDGDAWLRLGLNEETEVYYIEILNRYCGDVNDVNGCLCRMTNATLTLLDHNDVPVASKTLGNTCQESTLLYDFRCSHEVRCIFALASSVIRSTLTF